MVHERRTIRHICEHTDTRRHAHRALCINQTNAIYYAECDFDEQHTALELARQIKPFKCHTN